MSAEPWSRGRQYVAFAALSGAPLALTVLMSPSERSLFRPFFGGVDPRIVVGLVMVLGGVALASLRSRGWFQILQGRSTLHGIALSAGLATALAGTAVLGDFLVRYPENMNVPPPQALFFYPAIGYVAEIVLHVLPLTLLVPAVSWLANGRDAPPTMTISILVAALLEPVFQLAFMEEALSWAGAHTFFQVLAVNLAQLHVFRRYDFASMYCLRLFYYGYWHIGWGVLRLDLLF